MNKRFIIITIGIIFLLILAWAGYFYWQNLRGAYVGVLPPADDVTKLVGQPDSPIKLPPGFAISIFAKDLPGVRAMARDSFGNIWVSRTNAGVITLLEMREGKVYAQHDILRDLNNPHGLVFDPERNLMLFYAEEDKVSRIPTYSDGEPEKLLDLPSGGGHSTRTLAIGPDNRLYVSIGSSCNVCHEENSMRAKIFSMKQDGTDVKEFARGLRNAVFFTWSYIDGRMWATEMGRDLLGDDTPPDEINIITEGGNYGWPNCYGKNIHDDQFDKNTYIRNPCMEPFELPSYIDIPAHSAPLGLAFVPEEGWPEDYWYDLLVAYHGSWNRSEPTGYKIVRVKLDAEGKFEGIEDFATGWLSDSGVLGRPVGIYLEPGGVMYVTDDKAGVIYKINLKEPPR